MPASAAPKNQITTRPATAADLPAIHAIQTHYVTKTVMNFSYAPASLADMQAGYQSVVDGGYPYIVATASSSSDAHGQVVGYAYAHPFRERLAYQYTAELSIFTDAAWTGAGVGSTLMRGIVEALEDCSRRAEQSGNVSESDSDRKGGKKPPDVYQLIVCMSVDPDPVQAEKLKRFYQRHGFVETARLTNVGWKFGKWLDTRYMQRELKRL